MGAPFAPDTDVSTALNGAGTVWGLPGSLFALTFNQNLLLGAPRSPYEAGLSGVNPGVWVDSTTLPAKKAAPMLNVVGSGSLWFAGIRLWVLAQAGSATTAGGVDTKAQAITVARQLRDYFHTKVGRPGITYLTSYISAYSLDAGDVKIRKTNEARQVVAYTDFELCWNNVN